MVLFTFHARFRGRQYGPRDAILMTLAGSDGANYFGKQNMAGTAFRRKTGRSSSIFNLRIVNHVCPSQRRSHEAVGELADITKTLNHATLLSSFLPSRQSFFSLLESRKSQRSSGIGDDGSTPFVSRMKDRLHRTWPSRCRISNLLVIVITVILENNFESNPGEPLSASQWRYIALRSVYFFLPVRPFFKPRSVVTRRKHYCIVASRLFRKFTEKRRSNF